VGGQQLRQASLTAQNIRRALARLDWQSWRLKECRADLPEGISVSGSGNSGYGLDSAGDPTLQTAFLLVIAIWSFCRLYYFMFYVVEKYVDGNYKFAGIHSFVLYMWQKRTRR
jgi:hypothetical protein